MLVKLGFTKVSQLEQEVLLPDTGAQRALIHSLGRGQARPQVGVNRRGGRLIKVTKGNKHRPAPTV